MKPDTLVLYTQTGCVESARARRWLRRQAVPFVEHNVSDDPEARAALIATGLFATPLLVRGRQRVLGFRPERFEKLLVASDEEPAGGDTQER